MITVVVDVKTGKLISAAEAYQHRERTYRCPGCNCLVQIKVSSKGNYYAAKMPGCNHDPGCSTEGIWDDGRYIQLDNTDPNMIFRHILQPRKQSRGGNGPHHPGHPHEKELVSEIRSLRNMYTLGLCNQPDGHLGPKAELHDLIVNRYTVVGMDLVHEDLGARAVPCVPIRFFPDSLSIRFRLADGNGEDIGKYYHRPVFDLIFKNRETFWAQVAKLMHKDGQRYISRYKLVLICADWHAVPEDEYRGIVKEYGHIDGTYNGYQRGDCNYPNTQIFKPRNKKIK